MYSDLDTEEQILLAVEFLARGVSIPLELEKALGSDLMLELMTPERIDHEWEVGYTNTAYAS